ncbi:hypothetical protein JCM10212_004886 [Sporobolomyces blumeae]
MSNPARNEDSATARGDGASAATEAATPSLAGDAQPKLSPKMSTTYNEDVVEFVENGELVRGVVTRCWADEQNPDAVKEAERLGIPFSPLRPGYLEVLHPTGSRSEVLETDTTLIDRGFLRGDLVRPCRPKPTSLVGPPPAVPKVQAGQIVDIQSEVQLERVLAPHDKLDGWFDTRDLVAAARINRGDHVVSGEWIGLVEEVFEMAMIETALGIVRRVCDVGTSLSVGPATPTVQAMLLERTGGFLSNFMGAGELRTILDVKQIMLGINWLCKSQMSSSDGDSGWERPKRYWTDLDQLKLVRATADHLRTIHDKLVPRDPSMFPPPPPSRHSSTFPNGFSIFAVTNCRSTVTILWQDGTRTTGPSTDYEQVPTLDDETDVFPGDVGVYTGDGDRRIGVVQAMDARNRTIRLRYLVGDDLAPGQDETISGLEFDPHGPPPDAYGVRRGDWVLITKEGEKNGAEAPTIPTLGESETLAGTMPAGEQLRLEISTLGMAYAPTLSESFLPPLAQTSPSDLSTVRWYGEVWDLELDGRALIRFPDGTKEAFVVTRLIHLDDGMDPDAGALGAAADDEIADDEWMTDDGSLLSGESDEEDASDKSWETADEDEEFEVDEVVDETREEGGPSKKRKRSRRESRGWADEDDDKDKAAKGGDAKMEVEEAQATEPTSDHEVERSLLPGRSTAADADASKPQGSAGVSMPGAIEDFADWSRFEVLEEAPADHHFFSEKVQVPGKSFMSRVAKEHGVLATSLPPNILVRAYEDRSDLIRCLIIGPLGTPFQNAPFLFDLFLSPTKFPQEPPKVHFHSWAGGTRVSPNLYAEGKVCLSLLGTWAGDKTESWSAARSSLLQILISIQGLIMVEDPYFTEPGFEKQIGTAEGTAASELYNERTLVLTRTFVRRACEYPPASFEREIAAYYYTGLPSDPPTPGALGAIVEQCRALLEESEKWHADPKPVEDARKEGEDAENDAAAPPKPPRSQVVPSQRVLTEGAGLSLRRTLKALEQLIERGPKLDGGNSQ